jgi:cytochrome c biogenesis protein CcmG, thiol:disulfide interchange protein DsbE
MNKKLFIPLVLFLALVGFFAAKFLYQRALSSPARVVGKPAPSVVFEGFDGGKEISIEDFKGKVTLFNVFASWCPPCIEEHPQLMALSQDKRFQVIGVNYKDKLENARRFLNANGNPFAKLGVDEKGRNAIEWGVYGIPESFIIGRDGLVKYKHFGAITPENMKTKILPALEKALSE